jgi:SPP1 family predicted phage head-tail adaptor
MRAGRMDRRVTLQRATPTESSSGEPVEAWTDIVARRPASLKSVSGGERQTAPQWVAREQVEFRIRYSSNVADLSPLDRLIYPVPDEGDPIPEGSIFDIMAVHEIGRREGLQIMAARRADV